MVLVKSFEDTKKNLTNITSVLNTAKILLSQHITGVWRRRDRPGYFAKRNTERAIGRPCPRGLSRSDWGIKKMAGPHGQTISTLYINTQTNYPQYIGLYYKAY